ncbi:hypothetical protein [Aestuariirhabdus sp. LZHN29]|uniref:hypothetical protein n=1 Tax=Aestuariirhabdus sp. LZHN29 TaxID=3417462 RepID=UPI003CF53521
MNRRNFSKRPPKQQAKGTLKQIETDGPHSEWLGMPDYFIHTLTVDDEQYSYLSAAEVLDVKVGDIVVFRFQVVGDSNRIDKRSLGLWIDPATYNN